MIPVYPLIPCGEHAALWTSAAAAAFKPSRLKSGVAGFSEP
jgi:hypothetical protein